MRKLYMMPTFERLSYKFLDKSPHLKEKYDDVIRRLAVDVFDPVLKTHKLHGPFKRFYACRITYDQRIVFDFDDKLITLRAIGSHDEIY